MESGCFSFCGSRLIQADSSYVGVPATSFFWVWCWYSQIWRWVLKASIEPDSFWGKLQGAPSLCRRSSVTAFLPGLMHGMENLAPAHESNMNQYNFRSSGLMMMFIWCIWFFHKLHFVAYLDDWYVESFRYIIHQAWPFNATWWSERNGLKLCETHDLGDVLSFIVNRYL